jgi:hypothetical protein
MEIKRQKSRFNGSLIVIQSASDEIDPDSDNTPMPMISRLSDALHRNVITV